MSELIDDMLIGDYVYVIDGEHIYADVDFERRCAAEGLVLGVSQRRAGAAATDAHCSSPLRPAPACGAAGTAGARLRTSR
jgi:hypothetical protein